MSPDFDFGVNASREGLIEKCDSFQPRNWHWHEKALSEHGFYLLADTFHNQPRLDHHQGQILRTKTFQIFRKVKKSFLQ